MLCTKCGALNRDNANFCSECGALVSVPPATAGVTAGPVADPAPRHAAPAIELIKPEREQVKELAKWLLDKLKREKLVLDWRKKAHRKAAVRTCIFDTLDSLPDHYSDDLCEKKCQRVYEHVNESYWGHGAGKYSQTMAHAGGGA